MNDWSPTATVESLKLRANILESIRDFFREKKVLEVQTPLLCPFTVTDPHLKSLEIPWASGTHYLQTSPEYAMKRLLAGGSGCIYQICKAFRGDEVGRKHNPEFTMLEWYRLGFDHHDLMDEMEQLLQRVLNCPKAKSITYRAIFQSYCNIDVASASIDEVKECAKSYAIEWNTDSDDMDAWLDVLMSHIIEPKLGFDAPCFVYDYPASQSALAKIRQDDYPVAERFEVYYKGIELANGFHELTSAKEQEARFKENQKIRKKLNLEPIEMDSYFLGALQFGLPDCAGVALGIDRLVMLAADADEIREVMAFVTQ